MRNVGQPVWHAGAGREKKWNVVLFLMAIVVLMLPLASIATPQPTRESEQARDILQDGEYQPVSPGERMDGSERFSGSSRDGNTDERELREDGERDSEGSQSPDDGAGEQTRDASKRTMFDLPIIPFLATVLRIVMWIGMALLLLVFLIMVIWIIQRMASADHQTEEAVDPEQEDEEGETIDRSGMHETLQDADELAEQGKFTEAIRRMFKDAAHRIEHDMNVSLKKSETNHEFLDRFRASDVRKLCLVLVRAVDQFYYGGKPCDESDYRRCRKVWKKVQSRAGT